MKFFVDCQTEKEVKDLYRKLAKLFHTDKGGDKEIMLELQGQYNSWSASNEPSSTRYTFNTHIPFDHPIHEELRSIKNQLRHISAERDIVCTQNRILASEILNKRSQITNLLNQLSILQKEIDNLKNTLPKTIWQYLKKAWAKNEKPS